MIRNVVFTSEHLELSFITPVLCTILIEGINGLFIFIFYVLQDILLGLFIDQQFLYLSVHISIIHFFNNFTTFKFIKVKT